MRRLPDTLDDHERVLVLGKTGVGKSFAVKAFLRRAIRAGERIVVFDPKGEYAASASEGPCTALVGVDDLLRDPARYLDSPRMAIAVVPATERRACAEDFREVSEQVARTGHLIFVADEVGYWGRATREATDALDTVSTLYRHHGVAVVCIAQRAMQVPPSTRAQASQVWSGLQSDPEDLRELRRLCGEDYAAAVAGLPRQEIAVWHESDARAAR